MEGVRNRGDAAPCDSCGALRPVDDLRQVRRAYYVDIENPEPIPQQEIEMWCSGCRETYPNTETVKPSDS